MLRDQGMNLLLAVGQGAKKSPPRLHIVAANLKEGEAPLALFGKGITFDTGGINLKPHESFRQLHEKRYGRCGTFFRNCLWDLLRPGIKSPYPCNPVLRECNRCQQHEAGCRHKGP